MDSKVLSEEKGIMPDCVSQANSSAKWHISIIYLILKFFLLKDMYL